MNLSDGSTELTMISSGSSCHFEMTIWCFTDNSRKGLEIPVFVHRCACTKPDDGAERTSFQFLRYEEYRNLVVQMVNQASHDRCNGAIRSGVFRKAKRVNL